MHRSWRREYWAKHCLTLGQRSNNVFLVNASPTQLCFLFDLILYVPVNNLSVTSGRVFLGWTSTKQGLMYSDAGEARTHGPSVSSQALYHWVTALLIVRSNFKLRSWSHCVKGTGQHFLQFWVKVQGQIEYFLANASLPKPFSIATSDFAGA